MKDLRPLIAKLRVDGYKDGSSAKPGWVYHPLPVPGYEDIPVHRPKAKEEAHAVLEHLKASIGDIDGARVLDVGCALGLYARPLVEAGADVVAYEADMVAAEIAGAILEDYPNARVNPRPFDDVELRLLDGQFDATIMMNVHMWIRKQIGWKRTCSMMRELHNRSQILYFQTAHQRGSGMYRVPELQGNGDVRAHLHECGWNVIEEWPAEWERKTFVCES